MICCSLIRQSFLHQVHLFKNSRKLSLNLSQNFFKQKFCVNLIPVNIQVTNKSCIVLVTQSTLCIQRCYSKASSNMQLCKEIVAEISRLDDIKKTCIILGVSLNLNFWVVTQIIYTFHLSLVKRKKITRKTIYFSMSIFQQNWITYVALFSLDLLEWYICLLIFI